MFKLKMKGPNRIPHQTIGYKTIHSSLYRRIGEGDDRQTEYDALGFDLNQRKKNMDVSNIKKWIIMYPVYINSKKTIAEGRRISTTKACENPICVEIADSCSYLKLPHAIELDKAYPRDFMQRGRVRVMLKREDGTLTNPAIKSRKDLMIRVAELVPKHSGRTKKQESAAAIATTGAGSSKSGKGGKKKR